MRKRINSKNKVISYLKNNSNILNNLNILNYNGTNKILVEDKYGKLLTTFNHLKNNHIPTIRTAVNKTKYCINQFKEIHGNKYDYSNVKYVNDSTKVKIICYKHGEFLQTPNDHKNKSGCYKCSLNKHKGLYNLKNLKKNKNWNNIYINLYLLKFSNSKEEFYKIGISKDVNRRIQQLNRSSNFLYNIEEINSFKLTIKEAIELENKTLSNKECFKHFKPKEKFRGYTECFNYI